MNRAAAMVVVVGGLCSAANAQLVNMTFELMGINEVPPNASIGHGMGNFTLNVATGEITAFSGFYHDLTSESSAAHFHRGPAGVNGPVVITLGHGGATSGLLTLPGGPHFLTPADVVLMLNGGFYINLHSDNFPGGELRGQIVPAPAAFAVFGAAGLAASRRRRR